jgi:molybdopterin molybdotransferase
VRAADVASGKARLTVIDEVMAGHVPARTVDPGQATRLMTGAPLPDGADAVVQVEHTRARVAGVEQNEPPGSLGLALQPPYEIEIDTSPVQPGRSILKRGDSHRAGSRVLEPGRTLRPQELACLAELGQSHVAVHRRPRIAVLATGDELVSVDRDPGPGQIRNSNETMLVAQLKLAGAEPVPLGIARDERGHLRERIAAGLEYDMLLLSGGVSAGKLDLVPSVLAELGVRQVFHKVKIKPGQPLWFGTFSPSPRNGERGSGGERQSSESHLQVVPAEAGTPISGPFAPHPRPLSPCGGEGSSARSRSHTYHVFGLPGNPVSTMVCFELFVRTAIRRRMGITPAEPRPVQARLTEEHVARGPRPTYHPAWLDHDASGPTVRPVRWVGSADLTATVSANAMALFPAGDRIHRAGEMLDVFPW